MLVLIYLAAIVLANLSVAYFGPASTIINAFLLIGLDLSARDALHERWHGKALWTKMFALIAVGSLISFALNAQAGPIALASLLAFLASGVVDALTYHALRRYSRLARMIGSNVPSAAVDSLVFPTVAFGGFIWTIVVGQFLAKVVGGALWALVLNRRRV
jgi:hypothetical protein